MKKSYKVLGVMSGTSLDGIDLAECFFSFSENGWKYRLGVAQTIPYPAVWKNRLKEAIHFSKGRLHTLNKEYTFFLAEVISGFITKNDINNLDAICSHGHTVLHQPEKGITLQIGNLPEIAQLTKQQVVCNFRVQDVALGGQGAPLVPIGDQLLFSTYDYCLNLGGFANCSYQENNQRIAYDICPVNIVLNSLAETVGLPYDDGGKIATSGQLHKTLFNQLNAFKFYTQLPPKSLGLEWVQQHIFPLLKTSEISVEDKLHTFTESVAWQLASQFEVGSRVLITGGGAYNTYLIDRIRFYKKLDVVIPDNSLIDYKEALVFGLLGVLRLRGEVNCLASVTGAKKDHVSGQVF